MTSPSRRNRPTTPRRAIRRATAISLALLGAAATATAQTPAASLGQPVVTNWSPPQGAVPQAAPIGTRVIVPGAPHPTRRTQEPVAPGQPQPGTPNTAPVADAANVFRLSNDRELNERMLNEINAENLRRWEKDNLMKPELKPVPFTLEKDLPKQSPPPKGGGGYETHKDPTGLALRIEPSYVVHRRLFFEEKNSERYGWEIGIAQPAISAAYFAKDVLLWPSNLASSLFEQYDTSAGKCPPGSPVPYLLYPPEITLFGGTVGAAAIIGTAFLIP